LRHAATFADRGARGAPRTHLQFVLLASLTWLADEEAVTQRRLADHASTDPMMTSQVLRVLERRGLVERRVHPADARARAAAATASGRALAGRAVVAVEACDDAFFATLADVAGFCGELCALRAS
jgi:DNA-binding MarR family transcriptional regulator